MAHMTNKKRIKKAENDKRREYNPMNTGTRNMGFNSNNDRKDYLFKKLANY